MKGLIKMEDDKIAVIMSEQTKDFLEEPQKNQISDDFLGFRKKVEELFEKYKNNL